MPSLITPSAQEIKAIERDVAPLFQAAMWYVTTLLQVVDRAAVSSLRACRKVTKRDIVLLPWEPRRPSYCAITSSVRGSVQVGCCAAPPGG